MSRRADRRTKLAATHKAFRRSMSSLIRELGSLNQIGYDPQTDGREPIGHDSQSEPSGQIGYDSKTEPTGQVGYDPQT